MMPKINILLSRLFDYRADYELTSRLFIRLLALVYLIAFLSLAFQITGLVGPHGILPFDQLMQHIYQSQGWEAWLQMPNVFIFGASDPALLAVTCTGVGFALMLLFGIAERLSVIVLFALYLSLCHAGQIFLSFQWDSLLLESGFLAIFLISGPTAIVLLMYEWLLFRFRFMSGVSKLATGDPSWSHFTALDYYFQTQPLPHIGSWYAQLLPHWLHAFGIGFTFFTELVVPFMIFLPRQYRITAAAITIFMQLLIIATSNHAFVNVLVIILCVLLLDDQVIKRCIPRSIQSRFESEPTQLLQQSLFFKGSVLAFAVIIVFVSTTGFYMYVTNRLMPATIVRFDTTIAQWGIGRIYHIFPTMQRERQELIVQGSLDGKNWKTYQFLYKPGPLSLKPAFIVPYQPRLDWMMWFVPTQSQEQLYWFNRFEQQLRKGSSQVLALLKTNPFPDKPPRFIRAEVYDYQFTSFKEHERTGNWWKRHYLGIFPYVPPRNP